MKNTLNSINKILILAFFLFFIFPTTQAQSISSGKFTTRISDLKTRSYTREVYDTKHKIVEYFGNYEIFKKGKLIKSHDFEVQIWNGNMLYLHLNDTARKGYPLTYDYNTKKYEIANKKFKPKKTNTIESIILSGILIHLKYFKD